MKVKTDMADSCQEPNRSLPNCFSAVFSRLFSRVLAEAEPMLRRLITLIFADWIPPDLASSRSFLSLVA